MLRILLAVLGLLTFWVKGPAAPVCAMEFDPEAAIDMTQVQFCH